MCAGLVLASTQAGQAADAPAAQRIPITTHARLYYLKEFSLGGAYEVQASVSPLARVSMIVRRCFAAL